jgi:predicted NBD/HSP70 family sugar kinase
MVHVGRVKSAGVGMGASPTLLRQLNSAAVLRAVRQGGPASRPELAKLTGLSRPTVNSVVDELLRAGYLRESVADGNTQHRRPGPRPRLVRFRADLGYVLGLDIGANKVLALVADLGGRVVASERRRASGLRNAEEVLATATNAASVALGQVGLRRSDLLASAVGTPGVVELQSGQIAFAPQLPGWEGLPLAGRLSKTFGEPFLADNEVHLALIAERWLGAIQGVDDALYVQFGIGIGAGILIGGQLYRGATGAAGEIGYMPVADPCSLPPDGVGQFEHAAGGRAFARLGCLAARGAEGALLRELGGGDPTAVDAEVVFAAALRGDIAAQGIVDQLVRRLAKGVAAAVALLNPSVVVVGGGLSRAGQVLLEPLEGAVQGLVPVAPRFVLSALGDEAVALGAVKLALDVANERLLHVAGVS